jgi:hypothetical protein
METLNSARSRQKEVLDSYEVNHNRLETGVMAASTRDDAVVQSRAVLRGQKEQGYTRSRPQREDRKDFGLRGDEPTAFLRFIHFWRQGARLSGHAARRRRQSGDEDNPNIKAIRNLFLADKVEADC